MSRRILVTGATGETGRYTTDLLISQGFEIRALVHKVDERSEKLRARGAEVIVGDLLDFEAVRHATRGVDAAYFVYPIRPGLIDATAYFAQASKEAGLNGVVNMSQISAREDPKNHAARDHWIAERVFDWSGVPTVHIRPTLFAQCSPIPQPQAHIGTRRDQPTAWQRTARPNYPSFRDSRLFLRTLRRGCWPCQQCPKVPNWELLYQISSLPRD